MPSNEQTWAYELQRAKNTTLRNASSPISLQKKTLEEQIRSAKVLLFDAIGSKDVATTEKHLKAVIQLRAKQTAILIEEVKQLYGNTPQNVLDIYTKTYARDCMQLTKAVQHLLVA